MRVTINDDKQLVKEITANIRANDGHCPCAIEHTPDTLCMCKHFREQVAEGQYCNCGLYKKIEK